MEARPGPSPSTARTGAGRRRTRPGSSGAPRERPEGERAPRALAPRLLLDVGPRGRRLLELVIFRSRLAHVPLLDGRGLEEMVRALVRAQRALRADVRAPGRTAHVDGHARDPA